MKALVLEKTKQLSLRDIDIEEHLGPHDVRIKITHVGVCGSDVHYYLNGKLGPFVVKEPMVLGHEASGVVIETGEEVKSLKIGDKVCMEPGVPDLKSKATMLGLYNLDPGLRFWATPPDHGCLRESVVHPAMFTFKLPENVSLAEGAFVEPFAVGLHAVQKAGIKPGDVAVVTGAGTIGLLTGISALAGGCSTVIISDIKRDKLNVAASYGMIPVDISSESLTEVVSKITGGWGANVVFEASGSEEAANHVLEPLCPGGTVVHIGVPVEPIRLDIGSAQAKEARIVPIFRYANVYERALSLMGSGKVDVKPLITDTYPFEESIAAFEYAASMKPTSIKVLITL